MTTNFVSVTIGYLENLGFKPRQSVVVRRSDPLFNKACAAEPKIGTKGVVVLTDADNRKDDGNSLQVPEGKIPVRFLQTDLGYASSPDHKYLILFYDAKCF